MRKCDYILNYNDKENVTLINDKWQIKFIWFSWLECLKNYYIKTQFQDSDVLYTSIAIESNARL